MKKIISKIIPFLLVCIALSASYAANNDLESLDISLINQNPNPAYAGDIVELTLGIENAGYGSIEDVYLEIEDEYPFQVISEKNIEISQVFSSSDYIQTQKVKLKINSDTKAGDYDLIIKEIRGSTIKEHSITVSVASNNNVEIININKYSLSPGSLEEFSFTIKNVGSTDLRNIEFSLEDVDEVILPVTGDNKVFIKELGVDEEQEVSFLLSASSAVSADLYKIDITLTYEDVETSEITTETSNAGIYVGGETSFDIILDEISDNEYIFTIANIGSNDASSVKVGLPDSSTWIATQKRAEIIGDLNKGDYTTLSFEFSKSMEKLILQVDYTDTSGTRVFSLQEIVIPETNTLTNMTRAIEPAAFQGTRGGPMSGLQSGINSISKIFTYLGYLIIVIVAFFFGRRIYKKKYSKIQKPD